MEDNLYVSVAIPPAHINNGYQSPLSVFFEGFEDLGMFKDRDATTTRGFLLFPHPEIRSSPVSAPINEHGSTHQWRELKLESLKV